MQYKERLLAARFQRLVRTFPVVVVSGARQVGKSTLLKHTFPAETDCVVFDPIVDVENARQQQAQGLCGGYRIRMRRTTDLVSCCSGEPPDARGLV